MGAAAERQTAPVLSGTAWLVEQVVKSMVNVPDDVVVNELAGEQSTLLEVRVHPEDFGRVLGIRGRNIAALRDLLYCIGAREQRDYVVKMLEPGR